MDHPQPTSLGKDSSAIAEFATAGIDNKLWVSRYLVPCRLPKNSAPSWKPTASALRLSRPCHS